MVAAFHADHVIGATIANLSAARAGLDAVLHVRIGRLIVVMHKAPSVRIVIRQDAKARPRSPTALKGLERNHWDPVGSSFR